MSMEFPRCCELFGRLPRCLRRIDELAHEPSVFPEVVPRHLRAVPGDDGVDVYEGIVAIENDHVSQPGP